jgi:methionyl-tRNA formyltransferase
MINYNIVLACSGLLGGKVLKYLYRQEKIVAVLTDKKSIEIIEFCNKMKIGYYSGNARSDDCFEFIQEYKNSLLFSVNYLFLFDEKIINLFKYKFNIHGSLLPKYRGRTPHVWAIINNEKKTGITIHNIAPGCDSGDIQLQKKIQIKRSDTGGVILKKYFYYYPRLIKQFLSLFEGEKLHPQKQNEYMMSYFGKRTPEDGKIIWDWQRERIYNWVRALAPPYPGAFCYLDDIKIIINKVIFSDCGFSWDMKNGTVVAIDHGIIVKTSNGCIKILDYDSDNNISFKKGNIIT